MTQHTTNFQQETSYTREMIRQSTGGDGARPRTLKEYPEHPRIALPEPDAPEVLLDDALNRRRSRRQFAEANLTIDELSYLLWAAAGVQRFDPRHRRTAPSAGAQYPIETYVIVNRVDNVSPGIYHYAVQSHELEVLRDGDFRHWIAEAALGQQMCSEAGVVLVFTAIFERTTWRYGDRGMRYVYLDAGHIGQNVSLACAALKLSSCTIGAFYDSEINELLRVDGEEEAAILLEAVGRT